MCFEMGHSSGCLCDTTTKKEKRGANTMTTKAEINRTRELVLQKIEDFIYGLPSTCKSPIDANNCQKCQGIDILYEITAINVKYGYYSLFPELLEALKEATTEIENLSYEIDDECQTPSICKRLYKLIAKAEGK